MSLLIAMPGPQPAQIAAEDPVRRDSLPALPELTALLTHARRLTDARDWRSGVLAELLPGSGVNLPAAAVAARALAAPLPDGSGLCFATPLHVVPGMSRVHLPPGGWLSLDAQEARRWQDAFNRELGGPDLQLHESGGSWLLAGPCAAAARDAAPESLVGEALARAAARDAAERDLRRLGAEVEIWLAGHALNREREARALPPLNCLWFWGGALAAPLPPLARVLTHVMCVGDADAWLAGLAAHCQLAPATIGAWQLPRLQGDTLLVLSPPRTGMSVDYWQWLETHWFAPAWRAFKAGEITALRLQIGATAWRLPDPSPLRWFRRHRPWYRQVAA